MVAPSKEQVMVALPSLSKVMVGVGTVTLPNCSVVTAETLLEQVTATVTALKVVLGVCHSMLKPVLWVSSVPLVAEGSVPLVV